MGVSEGGGLLGAGYAYGFESVDFCGKFSEMNELFVVVIIFGSWNGEINVGITGKEVVDECGS